MGYNDYNTSNQDEEIGKSKFNAAFAQLYRLDTLWQGCHLKRLRGDLVGWNYRLDCIWTELASDSDKTEDKKFNSFINLIGKYKNNKNILYNVLMKKEIWLRRLQNTQGKGTAYEDPDEYDFE